jgi:hypothetical protein
MTNPAYITAYQALISQYLDNQTNMEDHLVAVQVLKDRYYREAKPGAVLPVMP